MKNQCPERNKTTTPRSNAKVNACQLQAPQSAGAALHTAMNENVTRSVDAEVQVCVGTETINDAVLDVKHEKSSPIVDEHIVSMQQQLFSDEYAKLHYVNVKIANDDNSNVKLLSDLCDSGAEISVVRTDVLGELQLYLLWVKSNYVALLVHLFQLTWSD